MSNCLSVISIGVMCSRRMPEGLDLFPESNCTTNERPVIRGKEVLCAHLSSVVLCAELVLDIVVRERSLRDAGDRHCGLLLRSHRLSCNAQRDKFNAASTQHPTDLIACSSADMLKLTHHGTHVLNTKISG